MKIEVKTKTVPIQPPSWRLPQTALEGDLPPLWWPGQDPRPRHDDVLYETHVALPQSLTQALRRRRRYHVNPALEHAAQLLPALRPRQRELSSGLTGPEQVAARWQRCNRVYVTASAVTWHTGHAGSRHAGMVAMAQVIQAESTDRDRLILHTANHEFRFPPLCRSEALAAAINRVLSHGPGQQPLPSCRQCIHYRRLPMAGNRGDCAIQPELTRGCCPLSGFHDRCSQLQPTIPETANAKPEARRHRPSLP